MDSQIAILHFAATYTPLIEKHIYKIFLHFTKIENEVIQTKNGIILPPLPVLQSKIFFLQNVSQRVQILFSKPEMESSKQNLELFLPLPGLQSRNVF